MTGNQLTAFVVFIKTYAIWIYILCGIGILAAIKMLMDARILARTTLFSLEQERAGEQYYRGIVLILFLVLVTCVVLGVNVFVALPSPDPIVVKPATPTVVVTISAVSSPPPTSTPAPTKPAETGVVVIPSPIPAATRTPTRLPPTPIPPTPTPFALPAPVIRGPVPNGGAWTGADQAISNLVFRWEWNCAKCVLGPEDDFMVVITWTDRTSGAPRVIAGTTRENFLSMRTIERGSGAEVWHQAREDRYAWNVQVRRDKQLLTPPSETWKFDWH